MRSIIRITLTTLLSCSLITPLALSVTGGKTPQAALVTQAVKQICSFKNPEKQFEAVMKLAEGGESTAFILTVLFQLPAHVLEGILTCTMDNLFLAFSGIDRNKIKEFEQKIKSHKAFNCKEEYGVDIKTMSQLSAASNMGDLSIQLLIQAIKKHPLKTIRYDETKQVCLVDSAELKTFLIYAIELLEKEPTFPMAIGSPIINMWKSTLIQTLPQKNTPIDLLAHIMMAANALK